MLKRFIRPFLEMFTQTTTKRAAEEGAEKAMVETAKKKRREKNVKYAVLLSYQGQNYFGMQYQRKEAEFPTVESHLLRAMLANGFINQEHMDDLFPWHFQRAARTDRSVSAVRQICSMFLPMDKHFIDNGVQLLNSSLPEDIRVFGIRRVTPGFHSQKFCDGRTYSYTLPTFAFAACDQLTTDQFRITEERIEEIRELLNCFIGTHNFFNYTSGLEFNDQRVRRKILEIRLEKPFLFTDPIRQREVEFMRIYIKGQSFILHQIRKMIGFSIAILRGFCHKSDITRSFLEQRMDIPRAPGLGLLLERLHYDRFERRYLQSHGSLNDWGDEVEKDIVAWRDQWIMQRILSEECRTQSMIKWLSTLPLHIYILNPEDESGENVSALRHAAQNAIKAAKQENEKALATDGNNDEENDEKLEEEFEGGEEMPAEEEEEKIDGIKVQEEYNDEEKKEEKPKKVASSM